VLGSLVEGRGESFVVAGENDSSVFGCGETESEQGVFGARLGDAVVSGDSEGSKTGTNKSFSGEIQPSPGMKLKLRSLAVAGVGSLKQLPNSDLPFPPSGWAGVSDG
jgi:hypothetical protein